jgi:N-acetylglucosaminyl-diphospho-decaprenol L-rhamnosyltransferase
MKITPLIISYRSLEKLRNCINSIGENFNILIIENSNDQIIKDGIESEYKNCKVVLNNSNLGYSKASNIGFDLIKSDYALLLNTDIVIKGSQIKEMEKEIVKFNDEFTLASPISDDLIDFCKNNKLDSFFDDQVIDFSTKKKISKVDLVKGCSLLVNLKKFQNKDIFDKNFFFFFEEIDLCRRIKEKGENIYIFNDIKIEHKSAQSVDENLNINYHNFRHWNFFWGRFYYFKKHYGLLYSISKHIGKLIRFGFNIIRYFFISKPEYQKNKYRFLGLFSSMIGKSSSLSLKILEK